MREILFRGKRVDNGEWVYGFYIKATHHWHDHGIHEDWIATDTVQNGGWCNVRGKYAVLPDTVGQYTGLTDKNGKKIFEGDIVKGAWNTRLVIYYDDCYLQFRARHKWGENEISYYGDRDKFEIIGNVHDNPELLKGGAEW